MKKRVLILYDHFYPAYKAGGPVQSLVNLIRQMHQQLDFFVVCKPHEMNESEVFPGIKVNEWNNWEQIAKVMYWNYKGASQNSLQELYKEVRPDIIFINGLFSLHFNLLPLRAAISFSSKYKDCKVVLSARGMLHPGALSQKKFKKKIFLIFFKLFGWQHKVQWHATDEQELKFIQQQFGELTNIKVAGNFPNLLTQTKAPDKREHELIMGTVALISPMKNHLQVLTALQSVQAKIVWHIYGPVKEETYWQQCKQLIQQLPSNIEVHYHGELPPAERSKTMEEFQLFIMPSKSENFGHAILEALSAGKPVITTSTTPFKHLQQVNAGYTVAVDQLETELPRAIQHFATMQQHEFNDCIQAAATYARGFVSTDQLQQQYQHLFTSA